MKKYLSTFLLFGATSLLAFGQSVTSSDAPTQPNGKMKLPYDSVYVDEEDEGDLSRASNPIVRPKFVADSAISKKEMHTRKNQEAPRSVTSRSRASAKEKK